ncbi:hypothetical protein H6F69_20485 [Leptolyngbya sp. FACHB-1624]|nr:hypothetical protein [Leptolyngbya sp. FACHB-1624]
MYDHLEPLKKRLRSLEIDQVPDPWKRLAAFSIGGLRSVGYDRESDNLLVVSSQGRGVIDCLKGQKIARDDEEYYENETYLEAQGIGILSDRIIRMAGLFGGGLPTITEDGWQLECVTLSFPEQMVILLPPNSYLYSKPNRMTKIYEDADIRAYGFSYSGKSFVIATPSDVTIFARG